MGDGWQQEDAFINRQPQFREMERLANYEMGVHFVDVFRYLGGEITKVCAKPKNTEREYRRGGLRLRACWFCEPNAGLYRCR